MGSRGKGKSHRWRVQPLTPLMEGPDPEAQGEGERKESSWGALRSWVWRTRVENGEMSWSGRFSRSSSGGKGKCKRSDLRLALGILGCPLAPVSLPPPAEAIQHLSLKDTPIETSSAHYILHQYLAATGCLKLQKIVKNVYTTGTIRMIYCGKESAPGKVIRSSSSKGPSENGCFLLWQMSPGMWSMELAIAGLKIVAGSNGKIVWRHIPWLGLHAAKGPQRLLRRIVQGLDPKNTASMFTNAQCLGERRIGDQDCFLLRVSADQANIAKRSEGPAEVIRHALYGYFSQKNGLLVYIEDSHLTRVQAPAAETIYWETTIGSSIEDYREVDGILIAHGGRSVATVFRFSEGSSQHSSTRMEEEWRIDDVVFNVPGLSMDYFIPPAEILSTVDRL